MGLFAYVYRRTTAQILKEVQLESFEDNERMERLDVEFANLYIVAYQNYQNNREVRKSWEFAFNSTTEPLTILQHIMMGMNTHINLDLAIAVSTVMHGKDLTEIENDFNKINDILANIVNEMQDRISRVSPLLFLLDLAGKNSDEKVIDFSMRKARGVSWNNANLLWSLGIDHRDETIATMDAVVLKLSEVIKSPKSRIVRFLLKIIRQFEEKKVGTLIAKLREA